MFPPRLQQVPQDMEDLSRRVAGLNITDRISGSIKYELTSEGTGIMYVTCFLDGSLFNSQNQAQAKKSQLTMIIDVSGSMAGQRINDVKQYSRTLGRSYFQRRATDGLPVNLTIIPFNDSYNAIRVLNEPQFN